MRFGQRFTIMTSQSVLALRSGEYWSMDESRVLIHVSLSTAPLSQHARNTGPGSLLSGADRGCRAGHVDLDSNKSSRRNWRLRGIRPELGALNGGLFGGSVKFATIQLGDARASVTKTLVNSRMCFAMRINRQKR
jgi:hypothetical protein